MLNEQELQKLEDLKALKEKEGNSFHPTYQEELDNLLAKQSENSEETVSETQEEETVTGEGSTETGEVEGGEGDGEEKSSEETSQESEEKQEG